MPLPLPAENRDPLSAATPRASVPWLLAGLAAWLLATLGLRPLLLPDEGRYADVARAMLHADPWVPTLNGLPFFHKPPLFYWLDMGAMALAGSNEFTARIASAMGAWLMGGCLLLAWRRWHGELTGARTLVVLATTPFFFFGAQYANHDMLVAGLITAAVFAWLRALDGPGAVALRWLVGGWILCALALLAKGLIGVVLPVLILGPWLAVQGRWHALRQLVHPVGLLAFAVVCGPWLGVMQWRYPGFFDYFIVEQHFRRYAQSNFNNVHGAWFFLAAVPLLTLPWSGWVRSAVRRAWAERGALPGLYAWWVVAVVGFFSIPSAKLVGYVLPALAPWCALLSLGMSAQRRALCRSLACGAALVCLAGVAALAWKAPQSNRDLARALAGRYAPQDRIVMVDEYLYDVPFYARLVQPVLVASDWTDPELPTHDNWRKELIDAARFDPARGRELLVPLSGLERLSCGAHTTWYIASAEHDARLGALPAAQRVFADARQRLWRVPERGCA